MLARHKSITRMQRHPREINEIIKSVIESPVCTRLAVRIAYAAAGEAKETLASQRRG